MSSILVRKTQCVDCNKDVDVVYTPEKFEKEFEMHFFLPWNETPEPASVLKHISND